MRRRGWEGRGSKEIAREKGITGGGGGERGGREVGRVERGEREREGGKNQEGWGRRR